MWKKRLQEPAVRAVAELLAQPNERLSSALAGKLGVSRQMAHRHLAGLVNDGLLAAVGATRSRSYQPVRLVDDSITVAISQSLDEEEIWEKHVAPHTKGLSENVVTLWQYGVTEMVNNVRDHSGGGGLGVCTQQNLAFTEVMIIDDGVGALKKIATALKLTDERHAVFELTKGKFTTDPERHSGEGIFFTSRAFNFFSLTSGRTYFGHFRDGDGGWLLEHTEPLQGTIVTLRLSNVVHWTLRDVFDAFTHGEEGDFAFDKTRVPLRLAEFEGGKLISRSQAKRVTMRFERFRRILLDFEGVPEIGQGFADELFRVFARAHPNIELQPINACKAVARMIARTRSTI